MARRARGLQGVRADADEARYEARQADSAETAGGNYVTVNGVTATPAAGAYGDLLVAPPITPKISGRFLITAWFAAPPAVNGLTAALVRVFDGAASPAGLANVPVVGVDSGGTNTTRTIGSSVTGISGTPAYPLGMPITFHFQIDTTTQAIAAGLGGLTIQELPVQGS